MSESRLAYALRSGAVSLPEVGQIAVFRPSADYDLSALPAARWRVVQGFFPDHEALLRRGFSVDVAPPDAAAASVVVVPRARTEARALVAEAARLGPVVVDGLKTHGVEALLKDLRARVPVSSPVSKAHGKCFAFEAAPGVLEDWRLPEVLAVDGWVTAPGAFSADGPDPGSVALADALPERLRGRVLDLGAGWGYLSARVLALAEVSAVALVEADHAALTAARRNADDPRAAFHWADARTWQSGESFDHVVMNPPFHQGRDADPALGRAFIAAAAQNLTAGGTLWMVANRHLPYEAALGAAFGEVAELPSPTGYKLFRASRPTARPRQRR